MKLLVLLFLVGCATASVYEELDDAVEVAFQDFMLGLEDEIYRADDDNTEIGKTLRERLDEILEKMRDSLEQGKVIKEDTLQKLKEIREKMKELKVDLGNKAKEIIEKLKEKAKDYWQRILDILKGKEKRSVEELRAFDLKEMFQKLKKYLREKIDKEKLKAKIEEIFGKGNELADSLLKIINEKGEKYKQKIHDFIDRYLGKKEERSLQEYWEKIKEYFKNLHIELKEKYMKFGEWVKERFDKGMEKGKTKMENIKNIAKEFIENTKGVSKEVAVEALEFLRPYKEDLGSLWNQIKDTVKDVINKKQD